MNFGPKSLQVIKLQENAKLPVRSTDYAAGYDLYSLEDGVIPAKGKSIIKTGIAVRIPQISAPYRVYASIRSRSGLSAKYGIEVGAGVIDADYDKEIKVILHNHEDVEYIYNKHERIAQMILEVHITPGIVEVDKFEELISNRTGGFGSTGFF
jgi:deoxyuridine 5'-triphosphate nucleotidohydrolase